MTDAASPQVRVTHRYRAAAERVFDAWLDPALIGRWMFGPGLRDDEEVLKITVDARVGGTFSFVVRRKGEVIDHVGEYLEIDRPQRLRFTWGISDWESSQVEVDIVAAGEDADLTLTHHMHPDWANYADRTRASWTKMLEALAATIG